MHRRFLRQINEDSPSCLDGLSKSLVVNGNPTRDDYARFALFLNPKETKWSRKSLTAYLEIYTELLSLHDDALIKALLKLIKIASLNDLTDQHIALVNQSNYFIEPYFLYILCLDSGIPVSRKTTPEMMLKYLKYVRYSNEVLYNLVLASLPRHSKGFLTTLIDLREEKKVRNFEAESDRRHFIPQNSEEAVILAACNFQIDISSSRNAIEDYIARNFKSYPSLASFYNKNIPMWAYQAQTLQQLAYNEGFSAAEIEMYGMPAIFQILSLLATFHKVGPENISRCTNKVTPFYQEEIKSAECLFGYGIYGEDMLAITSQEIAAFFNAELSFRNPFNSKESISDHALNKLYLIGDDGIKQAIDKVRLYQRNASDKSRELIGYHDKAKAIKTLKQVLYLAFYMRGWQGPPNEYPITNTEVKNQANVDLKVSSSLTTVFSLIDDCTIIGQLPLLHYENGSYITSNSNEKGLTILDRLKIVKHGDQSNNVNSCIRLSSNWLVSSAYFYLSLLSEAPKFNIAELRIIA